MAHFAELSPYEYYPGLIGGLNVGWLTAEHPFKRGSVPLAFAHELRLLAQGKVENLTRGAHVCEFCQAPADVIQADPRYEEVWEMFRSGNGELHVQSEFSIVYCAPLLIAHYVAEHQYQPPEPFVEAVLFQRRKRLPLRSKV
jgi:hypothetical protein